VEHWEAVALERKLPVRQVVQNVVLGRLKEPVAHAVQTVDPLSDEKVPATQAVHWEAVALERKLPARQVVHWVALAALNQPSAQGRHTLFVEALQGTDW
jgi:hypothetical protein